MSREVTIILHEVATDGYPLDVEERTGKSLINKTAFIWDGCIISGWHLEDDEDEYGDEDVWEASEDSFGGPYAGVTHWVEFLETPQKLTRGWGRALLQRRR
jgi:hypothetical protein